MLAVLRRFGWMRELAAQPRRLGLFALSALLLSANWLLYVYAIQSGQVVEASLGYFINPLVNVLLGVLVLHERLNKRAMGRGGAGRCRRAVADGADRPPAVDRAGAGGELRLLRPDAQDRVAGRAGGAGAGDAAAGAGGAAGAGLVDAAAAAAPWPRAIWRSTRWLVIGGPLTALPLLLFAAGARRLPLATVGLLQYLSPTIQLALAVWVFHEPFDRARLLGFGFIWAGLALYSADGWRRSRAPAGDAASGRRRADQVVEGRQRRLRALAGGDDDLLEGHRRRIAGGEHAGQAGGAACRRR